MVNIRQKVVIVRGDVHGYIFYEKSFLLQRQTRKARFNTSSFRVLSKLFKTEINGQNRAKRTEVLGFQTDNEFLFIKQDFFTSIYKE